MSLQKIQQRLLTEYDRARKKRGRFTVSTLLAESGLEIDRSTLHRKLHGDAPFTLEEAEAIGRVLGVKVTVSVRKAAA